MGNGKVKVTRTTLPKGISRNTSYPNTDQEIIIPKYHSTVGRGLHVIKSGTKLYMCIHAHSARIGDTPNWTRSNFYFVQYNLSTPWDLNSMVFVGETSKTYTKTRISNCYFYPEGNGIVLSPQQEKSLVGFNFNDEVGISSITLKYRRDWSSKFTGEIDHISYFKISSDRTQIYMNMSHTTRIINGRVAPIINKNGVFQFNHTTGVVGNMIYSYNDLKINKNNEWLLPHISYQTVFYYTKNILKIMWVESRKVRVWEYTKN